MVGLAIEVTILEATARLLDHAHGHTYTHACVRLVDSSVFGLMIAFPLALLVIVFATKSLLLAVIRSGTRTCTHDKIVGTTLEPEQREQTRSVEL